MKFVFFLIKFVLRKFGIKFRIEKTGKFLSNVFSGKNKKKILISYITSPFLSKKLDLSHTNIYECYTSAEVFNELGYNVDVIDYTVNEIINYDDYDIIFGFGLPFENALNNKKIKKIFYGTGCCPFYSNEVTLKKSIDFFKKTNIIAHSSTRYVDYGFQYSVFLSDVIIGLGNEFVANSYEKYTKVPVAMLDLFYHQDEVDLTTKNYDNSKKHYLWFGSSGLLHKGLDLCLDFFIQNEEFILHICGASESETDFWRYYKPLIENKNNIINHGFINVRSEEFKKILKTTAYLLLPSVSEGGSPAVLTACGNGGLIPIIPKSCGLSLEDFGIVYSEGTDLGEILLNLKHENLKEKSIAIQKHIQSKYTLKRYRDNLKKIIIQFTE